MNIETAMDTQKIISHSMSGTPGSPGKPGAASEIQLSSEGLGILFSSPNSSDSSEPLGTRAPERALTLPGPINTLSLRGSDFFLFSSLFSAPLDSTLLRSTPSPSPLLAPSMGLVGADRTDADPLYSTPLPSTLLSSDPVYSTLAHCAGPLLSPSLLCPTLLYESYGVLTVFSDNSDDRQNRRSGVFNESLLYQSKGKPDSLDHFSFTSDPSIKTAAAVFSMNFGVPSE